jgi:hypothetical protein
MLQLSTVRVSSLYTFYVFFKFNTYLLKHVGIYIAGNLILQGFLFMFYI